MNNDPKTSLGGESAAALPADSLPVTVAVAEPAAPPPRFSACGNCASPLYGGYCYRCGQPEKGMIRSLREVGSDLADIVFNVDSRIFRSIFDLYFRPGFLTTEYCAGRRVRYVTPFRLFFVLCVLSIFAVQLTMEDLFQSDGIGVVVDAGDDAEGTEAATEPTQAATAPSGEAAPPRSASPSSPPPAEGANDPGSADSGARTPAAKPGETKPDTAETVLDVMFTFNDRPWDPVTNPVQIAWLPQAVNRRINASLEHMRANASLAAKKPALFATALFSVLPQTLFVLMPIFAVLLKIVYVFKRRLYMEHLMVALHSHAFIFLSMLVLIVLYALRDALVTVPAAATSLGWLITAAWVWLPLYLLLMQKRVYRQGWWMGVITYGVVGTCYSILLSLGIVAALVIGLAVT
ncbi:MAG TPA: DUF3667 domain-containing protein [Dokdonella sp.]|uniref:DUF3667 domain-containing protein n=1 Tax=Dokdonella sp. TaxID=2291710 RepID=UPI002CC6F001|nr:DUF3667 domain-containing protein [Dokdonella sp.]HUD42612.1 DUF3667 domain-containing protein [Dokdonella sp.]